MKDTEVIISYDVHVHFAGSRFKPSELSQISSLQLSNVIDPGEIAKKGRYKGEQTPNGRASLFLPETIVKKDIEEKLEWVLSILEKNQRFISGSEIETFEIHIDIGYRDQCSLMLEPSFLKRIANLNAGIIFDAFILGESRPNQVYSKKESVYDKTSIVQKVAEPENSTITAKKAV